MKALLISIGSRGDTEPFLSLADRLLMEDDKNSVDLFIQPELKKLAPVHRNLTVHELPFTQFDFYKYSMNPTKGQSHENERVRFVGIIAEVIAALCLPCWKAVFDVAKQDCDIMVTSALARWICFALTSKLRIPTVLIHLQQLVPTKLFPHYADVDESVKAIVNLSNNGETFAPASEEWLDMYWMFERYQLEFLQQEIDTMYDEMELQPRMDFETAKSILSGNDSNIYIANAMNEELIPRVTDSGPRVHQIGALADHYIPKEYEPPDDLLKFLSENHKPICIGFGSMPYDQVNMLLAVLEEGGYKAVLVGDALELSRENKWARTNVFQVSSVPYAWLLPRCQIMLCHGGAGVVHATLRAGIPTVISPFFGDQFFHAELCKARGLGARAGAVLPKATKDDFSKAIEEALSCQEAAQNFGEKTRSKSLGVDNLISLMSGACCENMEN